MTEFVVNLIILNNCFLWNWEGHSGISHQMPKTHRAVRNGWQMRCLAGVAGRSKFINTNLFFHLEKVPIKSGVASTRVVTHGLWVYPWSAFSIAKLRNNQCCHMNAQLFQTAATRSYWILTCTSFKPQAFCNVLDAPSCNVRVNYSYYIFEILRFQFLHSQKFYNLKNCVSNFL